LSTALNPLPTITTRRVDIYFTGKTFAIFSIQNSNTAGNKTMVYSLLSPKLLSPAHLPNLLGCALNAQNMHHPNRKIIPHKT
jgi:hypothetical protein